VSSRGPPVRHSLQMSTKPVTTRATTATRTECVRHGVGHKTPFLGCGSRNADEDPRPNILQLNTKGLTANKISVIEQPAQGWANIFYGGPHWRCYCYRGPLARITYYIYNRVENV